MAHIYRTLAALSLSLLPMLASAEESPTRDLRHRDLARQRYRLLNGGEDEKPYPTRYVVLSQEPNARVPEVYVAGGVATIIRLPAKLRTRGTKVTGGGEHRFEVLVGDRMLVVLPAQALARGERFPLIVSLADRTIIRLSLTSAREGHRADGEVQLRREPERSEDLERELIAMTDVALNLESLYHQALREQDSANFALAGLLAGGNAALTSFIWLKKRHFVDGAGRRVRLETYASRPDAPRTAPQVSALFVVSNSGAEALEISSVQGFGNPGLDKVPLAFRAQPAMIPPGGEGRIAVVLDRASFGPRDGGKVILDFFSKDRDGEVALSVDLTLEDFTAAEEPSAWWRLGWGQR